MQITADQTSVESLAGIGSQAAILLCAGNIAQLAKQYGYALAHGREPSLAIQEELAASLSELGATSVLEPSVTPPRVSYFKPNETEFGVKPNSGSGLAIKHECHPTAQR